MTITERIELFGSWYRVTKKRKDDRTWEILEMERIE